MKRNHRTARRLAFLMAVVLLVSCFPVTAPLAQTADIQVFVDGVRVTFDTPPVVVNGRTLVPLRAIFEAMGAEVEWVAAERMALATKEDTTVCLHLGSLYPTVNNEVRILDATAVVVNNRTLAPLRFVGEAFGGTVTWNGTTRTVNIYTRDALFNELPKTDVDFSMNVGDLALYETASPTSPTVRPGVALRLKVRVSKSNPTVEGGGKVAVTLGDMVVDVLPFYMDKGDDDIVFYKSYWLPTDVGTGTRMLRAVVEPDRLTRDPNGTNNAVQTAVMLAAPTEPDVPERSDARIVSVKVRSDFGEGVAKSGDNLAIIAQIAGSGKRALVSYEVNGHQMDVRGVTPPASGAATQLTMNWPVPWENNGLLRITVRLDNGEVAVLPVRVLPFEYGVLAGGITWQNKTSTLNYRAGENLALSAKVLRDNRNSFTDNFGALRAHFLINGQLSPALPIEPPSGSAPYLGDVHYSYPVPGGQTGPLQVQLLVDAGGLLREEREDNNSVSVTIPETVAGTSGNQLSVSTAGLRFAPSFAVPGEKVELMATIRNQASTLPTGSVKVLFKVNGQAVNAADAAKTASLFRPGQTYTVYKVWTVPETMTGDMTLSVEVDPDGALSGDNRADNIASVVIPMAKPDLMVEPESLVASEHLVSGGEGRLKARVYNVGPVGTENVKTIFSVRGAAVGEVVTDLPAHGMMALSTSFTLPSLPSLAGSLPLTVASGYVQGSADYQSLDWSVRIDPDNAVVERDEANNMAGPKALRVLVPASKGTVFTKAEDLNGNKMAGVTMTLATGVQTDTGSQTNSEPQTGSGDQTNPGTQTISGTTGTDGYCTFTGVPFGAYQLVAEKAGYARNRITDAVLHEGDRLAHETLVMDSRSVLTGTVRDPDGQPLSDVRVENFTVYSTQRTNTEGRYSLRLNPGTWTLRFSRKGYATITEPVTLAGGADTVLDKTMIPSARYQVTGTAVDASYAPIAGLTVRLLGDENAELATTVTDASGYYLLAADLPREEMWIAVAATWNGVTRQYPGYVFQGAEDEANLSWVPEPEPISGSASGECHVAPYVVCASMPGTFWNPDYEVEAIYGMFDLSLFATVENGVLTYLDLDTTPQWWVSATVSSSWDPSDLFGYGELVPGYPILTALLPLSVPLAVNMHSTNKTMVRIRKVSVMSGGREVYDAWPDAVGDFACAPNLPVDWNDCRVKLYLKADPDNGVVNPAAGYNLDRVLVEFDPDAKAFTKVGNYQVIGWDENLAREIYMDE